MVKKSFLIFLFLASCYEDDPCMFYGEENIYPPYSVSINQTTPNGVRVDASGQTINLALIDKTIEYVESCLAKAYPNGIPKDVVEKGWCRNDWEGKIRKFNPSCIKVKVPDSCSLSQTPGQQYYLLDRKAPLEGCQAKGLDAKPGECRWRAGWQENETAVVCQDLYLLSEQIVKYLTTCQVVWIDAMAQCAMPKTKPITGEWSE
jgi:hypothetical protein